RFPIRHRSVLPVGPDRIPAVAQSFFVGVAVLRNDRGDPFGMPDCKPETGWRAVVEYVDREAIETDHLGEALDDVGDIVERVLKTVPAEHVGPSESGQI